MKHSQQPGKDNQLVNQTADFAIHDFSMGEGDSGDTLGKGFGKYLQEEEESRFGQNQQTTFAFLEEAGLTNSPIQDGGESEQEEDS